MLKRTAFFILLQSGWHYNRTTEIMEATSTS